MKGRISVNWINRYIDEPLLEGAASVLRAWHIRTGQAPERLEPVWNLIVISLLTAGCWYGLAGMPLALSLAALMALALPSLRKLLRLKKSNRYDARQYKSARARAVSKREAEWSLRMTVLSVSGGLPFLAGSDDPVGHAFMAGACVWFVLTAPVKFYLDAAEPPAPDQGDRAERALFNFG
ncbi:hypothetical protein [Rhizobium sp. BE258]|uniref:hypothetical protein n=1 Tax=Rhizobium sp. BE258 TaxID=2817722 RepID=UPI00286B873C|nr:hypothetical protein [Rhizobium sp. BE258]